LATKYVIIHSTTILYEIKEDAMDRACRMNGEDEERIWDIDGKSQEERDH
jgi:hypothetical protein